MKKRSDGAGLAAIIDSLMFVCIVSALALLVLESPGTVEESDPWDRSTMIHSVLMHSTISISEGDVQGPDSPEAPVSELLCQSLGSRDRQLIGQLSSRLEPISDALVQVPYHYRWVVTGAGEEVAIGESALPDSCDIMASRVEMDRGGSAFVSILYLWIL